MTAKIGITRAHGADRFVLMPHSVRWIPQPLNRFPTRITGAEFDELRRIKAEAISHWVKAQGFHRQRKVMMQDLITKGFSQADIARELGVTRQAVQKMLTL